MEEPEAGFPKQTRSEGKSPWERPTVTLAGTIALLVRAGSAQGKISGTFDGDMSQFQACNPSTDPMCKH